MLYYDKNEQDEFPTIYFLHLIESLILIVGLVSQRLLQVRGKGSLNFDCDIKIYLSDGSLVLAYAAPIITHKNNT